MTPPPPERPQGPVVGPLAMEAALLLDVVAERLVAMKRSTEAGVAAAGDDSTASTPGGASAAEQSAAEQSGTGQAATGQSAAGGTAPSTTAKSQGDDASSGAAPRPQGDLTPTTTDESASTATPETAAGTDASPDDTPGVDTSGIPIAGIGASGTGGTAGGFGAASVGSASGKCPECGSVPGASCTACPLCRFMALLRGERPEATAKLVDGALMIIRTLRSLVPDPPEAAAAASTDTKSAGESASGQQPARRGGLEHIDIS